MSPALLRPITTPALLFLAFASACSDSESAQPATPDASPNSADAASGTGGSVVVMSTALGDLVVELATEEMPITTANFLAYVDSGFYDGTLIHRVIDDWVIQGGGYNSGQIEKQGNAPIVLETSPLVSHVHGAISMARTSDPNSATSQWFIVDWPETGAAPQPAQLDGSYAAFGILIDGFDVLEAITKVATTASGGLQDVPATEIVVTRATRR